MDFPVNQTSYSRCSPVPVWSSGNRVILRHCHSCYCCQTDGRFQPVGILGTHLTVDLCLFIWNLWILLLYCNSEFSVSYALYWYQCPFVLFINRASLGFHCLLQLCYVELSLEFCFCEEFGEGEKKQVMRQASIKEEISSLSSKTALQEEHTKPVEQLTLGYFIKNKFFRIVI